MSNRIWPSNCNQSQNVYYQLICTHACGSYSWKQPPWVTVKCCYFCYKKYIFPTVDQLILEALLSSCSCLFNVFVCRNLCHNVIDSVAVWHLHPLYCRCKIGYQIQSGCKPSKFCCYMGMSLSHTGLVLPENEDELTVWYYFKPSGRSK